MSDIDAKAETLTSSDWQWAHLPIGDFMPGDPGSTNDARAPQRLR